MQPSLVKGTRDFSAAVVYKRNYIFEQLRGVFAKYGFNPLETPAMEKLSTLTGKYGDEGDQLLFKILNNGNFLKKADKQALEAGDSNKLAPSLCKRALRYDLTVPFARFVVMNRNELAFPYKRYQIQPVWRGDRPAHGRYREFYQCDVDVIGSDSLMYEAELCQIYDEAFAKLGLQVIIRLNNRKILDGLATYCGHPDLFMPITVAIDKLDKVGWKGVGQELEKIGVGAAALEKVKEVINAKDLDALKQLFAGIDVGLEGVAEIEAVQNFLSHYNFRNKLDIDFSLARGLSYYTGCIFEVVVDTTTKGQEKVKMGSIGGGGRYADLTGIFGLKNMSGVGVSFGAARIYDVMETLGKFEQVQMPTTQVLFLAMDEASLQYAFEQVHQVRQAGIAADIYPETKKFKKLMKYADKTNVPFVVIIGSKEREAEVLTFKNMRSGEQEGLDLATIIERLG